MNIETINGDKHPNHKRIWGCLSGWSSENGRWAIELMTRDGYFRFEL